MPRLSVLVNGQRNVLVFRTGQLGDTIVSLPAIHAIRAACPDRNLILLTPRQDDYLVSPLELINGAQIFSEVLFYVPPSANPAAWANFCTLALKIRRLKPEAFFYLRGLPWNGTARDKLFFQTLCGIRNCYGLDLPEDDFGLRDDAGRLRRYPSEVDRLLKIVAEAGKGIPAPEEVDFGLPIGPREIRRIDSLWQHLKIEKDQQVIAIGPGSKMPAKRWPLDRFLEVARTILRDLTRARMMVFGGPEDFPLGEAIKRALGERVVTVAGKLTVLESAEALRRCCVYFGNDTGVMHLAVAIGTPCVAIFSARDHPGRWEPYGSNHIVLRKDPDCAGCFLQACIERKLVCLNEITVKEVLDAVGRILQNKQSAVEAKPNEACG
jgi:lipopolysaccharide heptosyltransferase III